MEMLKNKVALVTGSSSGIGRATALAMARNGASVAVASRGVELNLSLVEEIKANGGDALFIQTDVSKASDVRQMVATVVDKFGRLDCAFNNAGTIGNFSPLLEQSEEDWDSTIDTNLKSVWLCIREEAKAMIAAENGGAIVNTSSWLAVGGLPGSTTYSASKAGMDGLLRPAAIELAPSSIRVNNVSPGVISTEMTKKALKYDEQLIAAFANAHPGKRIGTPEEVADVVIWLCSEAASFVTGQAILVDGGYAIPGQRTF